MEVLEKPTLKVIVNDLEYQNALDLIKSLIELGDTLDVEDENYLEVLSILIEKYEGESGYKLDTSYIDAIDVLTYYLAENNLQQKDLVPVLGPDSRVSEIMNSKRKLSLRQIKKVNNAFKIPIKLLID